MTLEELAEMQERQPPLTRKMKRMMKELEEIFSNPVVEAAYSQAIANVRPYIELQGGMDNPWTGQTSEYFQQYFRTWFTYLPMPDDGLGKIIPFSYFYLDNPAAVAFLSTFKSRRNSKEQYKREIFHWVARFVNERGKFMDSPASTLYIEDWKKQLGRDLEYFVEPPGGYASFNEFFTRELKKDAHPNPRPIADLRDDSIAVAPADSVLNYIISDLTLTQELDIKSRQINVTDLLDGSDFAPCFKGGTAISCVLLPHDYHHFHSPVTGEIIESVEIPGRYFGIVDGGEFLHDFNFGQGTADFSVFEDFHRAYYLIETEQHGLVGVVPVGLNTISRIQRSLVCKDELKVNRGDPPVKVTKGDELGWFAYGGSLVILLFQKGVFSAVSLFMGSRIGAMSSVASDVLDCRTVSGKGKLDRKTSKKKAFTKATKKRANSANRKKTARKGKKKPNP